MIPSVPSEPTNNRVKSYPAADLRALLDVRIIRPSARTTVSPKTFSRIVPYRTAFVPEALVAAIPPSEASAPGSIGKNNPWSLMNSLSCFRVTLACTVQSKSSAFTRNT